MKNDKPPEELLQDSLALCAESISACLANADKAMRKGSPYVRGNEMDRAVALLQASARLADALARLRGRQTIHVTREGVSPPDSGSNGQENR